MQPTRGKAVFVRALVILNFDINCHFYTRHISAQNIGYRSTWSVIIGISIGPEKHISVDPYSQPRSNITRRRLRNPANPRSISTSSTTPLSFSVGLWNCQSAVNKADFISAFSLQSTLSILGLTETWIRPEDSATPAALSNNFSFSHTPRQVGRGGGTGLLISNNWKYSTHSPLCNYNLFESHAITVTSPIKLQIVLIYHPPGQILATFLEELDGLLSSFMEDGTPLLVFGDFNIHPDKHYATDFHSLIA